MTDVALNILALIAGGLTLELFTSVRSLPKHPEKPVAPATEWMEELAEFAPGNPS
jgi:hypothetical protein